MSKLEPGHVHNALFTMSSAYGMIIADMQADREVLMNQIKARDSLIEAQGKQLNELREKLKSLTPVAEEPKFPDKPSFPEAS
jgi:hypothetical protein